MIIPICECGILENEIGYSKFKTESKTTHRGLQIKAATLSLGYLLAPDVDLPRPKKLIVSLLITIKPGYESCNLVVNFEICCVIKVPK